MLIQILSAFPAIVIFQLTFAIFQVSFVVFGLTVSLSMSLRCSSGVVAQRIQKKALRGHIRSIPMSHVVRALLSAVVVIGSD